MTLGNVAVRFDKSIMLSDSRYSITWERDRLLSITAGTHTVGCSFERVRNRVSGQGVVVVVSYALFFKLYSTFQEAVHLIREGKDNDQPCRRVKYVMIAYAIVHHPLYYWIHFLSTLTLMTLAFWEQEAVSREENTLEEKAVTLYDNSFNGVGSMLIMYRCT